MKQIVLDVETGGFSPKENGLLSIGYMIPIKSLDIKVIYIKPEYNKCYEAQALEVNKLNLEELYHKGKSASNAISTLNIDMGTGLIEMIGHNIKFDYSFLKENSQSIGLNPIKLTCTKQLAKELLPRLRSHSLISVYNHLYKDDLSKDAHQVETDVLMTYKIYRRLMEMKNGK